MNNISKLIASNRGRLVSIITAFVVGGITQFVTSVGLNIHPDTAVALSAAAAAAAGWIVDRIAAKIANLRITGIQEMLHGVMPTGYIGRGTTAAVERLVASQEWTDDDGAAFPGAPLTADEATKARRVLRRMSIESPALAREIRILMHKHNSPPGD